ncbi:uncharacterized protein SPPG_02117 [Spizellomyces punctatus DAOM BR117]|uniref:LITAF domain-containing protein n=1 Tax=Spizellomyces punctatus (strain DAOM BR117) TaxID=645134 RepID=A0A0L0HNP3_SPIPD|nr:uncharacterized protein SPPG_02117 [Spizellomyces punctatus DAOM BR117]KND03051.1 hypothetical protein SPPG_02117 [Spizellomyces punctatus DAOM BR117]|eukprot:XP_016611090.1 hypothetical protein SPPG_02117 [Spizellomyces punctatus DAOM BR117]
MSEKSNPPPPVQTTDPSPPAYDGHPQIPIAAPLQPLPQTTGAAVPAAQPVPFMHSVPPINGASHGTPPLMYPPQPPQVAVPGQQVPVMLPNQPMYVAQPQPGVQYAMYPATVAPSVSIAVQQGLHFDESKPQIMVCTRCQENVTTRVAMEAGPFTWLMAGLICVICCPCAWIPFASDTFQDKHHYCPKCNSSLAVFKKM